MTKKNMALRGSDVSHVGASVYNPTDLTPLMTTEHLEAIENRLATFGFTRKKILRLAGPLPIGSGNVKKMVWFYFAQMGLVDIPPKPKNTEVR